MRLRLEWPEKLFAIVLALSAATGVLQFPVRWLRSHSLFEFWPAGWPDSLLLQTLALWVGLPVLVVSPYYLVCRVQNWLLRLEVVVSSLELADYKPGNYERGYVSRSTRDAVLRKWGLECAYCKLPGYDILKGQGRGIALVMEHVIPVVHGGESEEDNLVPACQKCNGQKLNYLRGIYRLFALQHLKARGKTIHYSCLR